MSVTLTGGHFGQQIEKIFGPGIISLEISRFALNERVTVKIERRISPDEGEAVMELLEAIEWREADDGQHTHS